MKAYLKTVNTEIKTIIDKETGEYLDRSEHKIQVLVGKDDFSLIFTEFWNILLAKPLSQVDILLLAYLVKNYADGTPFSVSAYIKKELAVLTNKSETSFNNSTRKLIKHGFIYDIGAKSYKLNPRYAFKGSTNNQRQAIIEMLSVCEDC
jgi:predicted transcriptional regulator